MESLEQVVGELKKENVVSREVVDLLFLFFYVQTVPCSFKLSEKQMSIDVKLNYCSIKIPRWSSAGTLLHV